MARLIFLTHPEVVIDPETPVPAWPLSAKGRWRMERFAEVFAGLDLVAVYSSDERKALDGAEIIADRFGAPHRIDPRLAENDRSSTGYVAPPRFWEIVEQFFGHPDESILGWETARAAQARIVAGVRAANQAEPVGRDLVIVSHGGVGRLLAAALTGVAIGEESRPEHPGGGCWLEIDRGDLRITGGWRAIEDPTT
jgi:broad specificity phosphatase PhoE